MARNIAQPPKSFVEEPLFTIEQMAEKHHVGKGVIYREVSRGNLGSVRVGRKILIPESCLHDYLARRYEPATA